MTNEATCRLYGLEGDPDAVAVAGANVHFTLHATDELGEAAISDFCHLRGGFSASTNKASCEGALRVSVGLYAAARGIADNAVIHLYTEESPSAECGLIGMTQLQVPSRALLPSAIDDLTSLAGAAVACIDIADIRWMLSRRQGCSGHYELMDVDASTGDVDSEGVKFAADRAVMANIRLLDLDGAVSMLARLSVWLNSQNAAGVNLVTATRANDGEERVGLFVW